MGAVEVSPDLLTPTHHVSLSDGLYTIGLIITDSNLNARPDLITRGSVPRTAMRTSTGDPKLSDDEPPWSPQSQADWSGGRGNIDFEKDVTRYLDGYRANGMLGKLFNGPLESYTKGYRKANSSLPGSVSWWPLIPGAAEYLAVSFTPEADYTAAEINLRVRRRGTPGADLTVELRDNVAGKPGNVLQSATITTTDISDTISQLYRCTITPQALTMGTVYWIVAHTSSGGSEDNWQIGYKASVGTTKQSTNGTTWTNSAFDLYYRITDAAAGIGTIFFQYRRAQYAIRQAASGAPQVFINGDRGYADSNAGNLTKLVDASKSWTTDQWAGAIVAIIGGPGLEEPYPYRKITLNSSTELTVETAWTIAHTTATEYVIVSSGAWTEITGHGLTVPITDEPFILDKIVYFCQGDDVTIRKMRWNTTTATHDWADEDAGTYQNKAKKICLVRESGGIRIWKANDIDENGAQTVTKATWDDDWSHQLVFDATIDDLTFIDQYGRINNLVEYDSSGGSAGKQLWIFKEGAIYTVNTSKLDEKSPGEFHTMMESVNGQATMLLNVYLYFNMRAGLERYYSDQMDDLGPDHDEGLPSERQGPIASMVAYAGKFFAAIDGGASGMSCVLGNNLIGNGAGYHEFYRAPVVGDRITHMQYQVIPGMAPDRLWVSVGDNIIWLPFPSYTTDPTRDANMTYTHESSLTSGYFYANKVDVDKIYHALHAWTEGLGEGQTIEVDYQVDDETDWKPIEDSFDTSPMQKIRLDEFTSITGKRFRYRLRMMTDDCTKTPVMKGIVLDCLSRAEIKWSFAFPYRMLDRGRDLDQNLRGIAEDLTTYEKQSCLDNWSKNLTPLTMRCIWREFDNYNVFIDPPPLSIAGRKKEKIMGRITVIEI